MRAPWQTLIWDDPISSRPLTEERMSRMLEWARDVGTRPSTVWVSSDVYSRYEWETRKTRIKIDWQRALFPLSTALCRRIRRWWFNVRAR